MFGLSMGQILIIVLIGVFLLGPDRIPVAVQWTTETMRKVRSMAQGAQAQLRSEIGPELDELRRQIADLQSLKELQELRALRDLNPRNLLGKSILGDEFSGGVTGLLGLGPNSLFGNGPADAGAPGASAAPDLTPGSGPVAAAETVPAATVPVPTVPVATSSTEAVSATPTVATEPPEALALSMVKPGSIGDQVAPRLTVPGLQLPWPVTAPESASNSAPTGYDTDAT